MTIKVVTGLWGTAYERHGRDFIETFARYWPRSVELIIYTDRSDIAPKVGELRQLETLPGYQSFLRAFGHDPYANGRKPRDPSTWKPGDLRKGYSWSHDAVKWFPQALIPNALVFPLFNGILCWLDADVITKRPVTEDLFEKWIGDCDGAYLGRSVHPDIGFWAVRMPQAMTLPIKFASKYLSGSFQDEREYHSAYIWDVARKSSELNLRNLSPNGGCNHVFSASPLAPFLDHRKGGLKQK